ncbi:polyprotein [Pegivirus sturnirae]|uniref:Genome polyprotein n=1 Tax=bat pegivirus I TaxID=2758122 RepID=N0A118_9FLAV|nr:polyprotein [Pegivirus sturnirae]AGK41018.1 polyprotein [bat pegivirus I]
MALLWLLLFVGGVGAFDVPASHRCKVGGRYLLSNCCDASDIHLCLEGGCWVKAGCSICSDGVCWDSPFPGISLRPGFTSATFLGTLKDSYIPAAWTAYVAGVLGLGEPFSLGLVGVLAFTRGYHPIPPIDCNVACNVTWHEGWWELKQALGPIPGLLEWLLTLPAKIWTALWWGGLGVLGLAVLLGLEQRLTILLALLATSGIAMGADPRRIDPTDEPWASCRCNGGTFLAARTRNASQYCYCANGWWYWNPTWARSLTWTWRNTPKRPWHTFPLGCPRVVRGGQVTVRCRWGSLTWIAQTTREDNLNLWDTVGNGSALCTIFAGGKVPAVSCTIDRRPHACGACVRDCFETSGSLGLGFTECGAGSRLTATLEALSGLHYDPRTGVPRVLSGERRTKESKPLIRWSRDGQPLHVVVTSIDGTWHGFFCPRTGPPPLLGAWELIPGRPVNTCMQPYDLWGSGVADMMPNSLWQSCFESWFVGEGRFYATCLGYAWLSTDPRDGFVHVRGWWQEIDYDVWFPPPLWLALDFLFIVIFLMKLAEAKIMPLLVIAAWWQAHHVILADSTTKPTTITPTPTSTPTTVAPTCYWFPCGPFHAALKRMDNGVYDGIGVFVNWTTTVAGALSSYGSKLSNWIGQFPTITADSAMAPTVVGTPLVAWTIRAQSWDVVVLGLLNLLFYWRFAGPVRLACLVAHKLARGLAGIVLLLLVGYARRTTSVLGAQYCVELQGHEQDWSVAIPWCFAVLVCWILLSLASLTVGCREWKLWLYTQWATFYQWVRHQVDHSPLGEYTHRWSHWLWVGACLVWPDACAEVVLWLILAAGALDGTDMVVELVLTTDAKPVRLARFLEKAADTLSLPVLDRLLTSCGRRGVWLYEHMGQVPRALAARLREADGFLEPARVTPVECEWIRDAARTLACGQNVMGKPVVCRRGDSVMVGVLRDVDCLPEGAVPCAPLVIRQQGKGFLKVMLTSMLGRDTTAHSGHVCVLGTTTTRSMGSCVNGLMFTTYHSCRARRLAGPHGPLNPRWWSTSDDVAAYPVPEGCESLEPCSCSPQSAWVLRNDGALIHGEVIGENRVRLDISVRISDLRGSSGSPILCDQGHAVGIMVSALHKGPDAHTACYIVPWKCSPPEVTQKAEPPPVPAKGQYMEKPLFLPTGSGKSTRVPAEYAQQGHRVLVLNPSIATVRALGPYMKGQTGKSPSVYCGHGPTAITRVTDSRLSYATYGRFMANPHKFLSACDIVICDECHSTDPTSVLGMGMVRLHAQKAGVKLVIFATATPAGSAVSPHTRIRERQLTRVGDIDFYGYKIMAGDYKQGRHLIFCHSKVECERVALALTKGGVKAVYYYRGRDPSVIPEEGDIVVVATDALMSGYSGNFDTVTDCNIMIEECVEVTLDPTIAMSLACVPATADVRMQRRGRCGRGKDGTYYYCLAGSAPSGVVPEGVMWSAVETGLVWFGLEPARSAECIRAFGECPYTAQVGGSLPDAVAFMDGLVSFRMDPEVVRARTAGVQWPLLVGVQRRLCLENEAAPPGESPLWKGIKGKNPTPLLMRWGGDLPERVCSHHIIDDLVSRLGVAVSNTMTDGSGPALLIGVGIAAACVLASSTGTLVIVTTWRIEGGGYPSTLDQVDSYDDFVGARQAELASYAGGAFRPPTGDKPTGEGETCPRDSQTAREAVHTLETQLGWEGLGTISATLAGVKRTVSGTKLAAYTTECCDKARNLWAHYLATPTTARCLDPDGCGIAAGGTLEALATRPDLSKIGLSQIGDLTAPEALKVLWSKICNHFTSLVTVGVAAWTAGRNPPLAAVASMVMGLQQGLKLEGRIAAALVTGAAGGSLGKASTGAAMAACYMVGGAMGSMAVFQTVLSVIAGWEAVATGASLAFDLWSGKWEKKDLWYGIACVGSPGGGIAGLAIGTILHFALRDGISDRWVNRILTMLPKGAALPDGFFEHLDVRERARQLLHRMSLSRLVASLLTAEEQEDQETKTGCSFVGDFVSALRWFLNALATAIRERLPSLTLPIYSCSRGYTGKWKGSGQVEAHCGCGAVITATIRSGWVVHKTCSSRLCRNWFGLAIPVNTLGHGGGASPDPDLEKTTTLQAYDITQWVEVKRSPGLWRVKRASCGSLSRHRLRRMCALPPTFVNGVGVTWTAPVHYPTMIYGGGSRLLVDGDPAPLPLELFVSAPPAGEAQAQKVVVPDTAKPCNSDGEPAGDWVGEVRSPYPLPCHPESQTSDLSAPLTDPEMPALEDSEEELFEREAVARLVESCAASGDSSFEVVKAATPVSVYDMVDVDLNTNDMESPYQPCEAPIASSPETPQPGLLARAASLPSLVLSTVAPVGAAARRAARRMRRKMRAKSTASVSSTSTVERPVSPVPIYTPPLQWHIECRCCCDKSVRAYYSSGLSVADVAKLGGFPTKDHWAVSQGTTVPWSATLGEIAGEDRTIRIVCAMPSEETKCGYSYIWSGAPLACGESKPPPITRPIGRYVSLDATKAYITDMRDVGLRVEKVTRERRPFKPDAYFTETYRNALALAKTAFPSQGYTYEEAIRRVRPRAAPAHNTKMRVKDLPTAWAKKKVLETIDSIQTGMQVHPFMLTAKQEVFFQDKKTHKPPRLICYPSLEFRVAEKMIMGDPGKVAKAILGKAYGFQYTPQQRVQRILDMWNSKVKPAAISVDAVCFDSSITSEDVERETELYAAASPEPGLVRALGKYYAEGPMINRNGQEVGWRKCRASGVLTTSSSNSITCYLKVASACRRIGLENPSFLIHGDDTIIIYERGESDPSDELKAALAAYGYECEPKMHASVDTIETCSSWLAECNVCSKFGGKPRKAYFLSCDAKRMLARVASEYRDPIATAGGYILLYPQHPVVRYVLIGLFLDLLFSTGEPPDTKVMCEVQGNTITFPLEALPNILVGIHGPDCLRVTADSRKTLLETQKALQAMGMRGLGYWRTKQRRLRVRIMRSGNRRWARLALALLWDPSSRQDPLPLTPDLTVDMVEIMSQPYQSLEFTQRLRRAKFRWLRLLLGVGLFAAYIGLFV